jgi:hypothetical protein
MEVGLVRRFLLASVAAASLIVADPAPVYAKHHRVIPLLMAGAALLVAPMLIAPRPMVQQQVPLLQWQVAISVTPFGGGPMQVVTETVSAPTAPAAVNAGFKMLSRQGYQPVRLVEIQQSY